MIATERVVAAGFPGKMIGGRYKLEKLLGNGAVGDVWLAEHVHMRKRFALKLLDSRVATEEIVARFEREAVAAANIVHPGIAAGTDFGRDEDGSFFLVLEYVAGKSLRALVDEGPVPPLRALGIMKQLVAAIGAAHAKGVVHRDLKPENIMLAEGGRDTIKVLDFGIAKIDPATLPGKELTRAGTVWGTPAYMAPEQAMGQPIDARADLWALGIVLFEMIAGSLPFPGDGLEVLAHIATEDAPSLSSRASDVTPELDLLVSTLLKRSRDERPADVAAVATLVEAAERSYVVRKLATTKTRTIPPPSAGMKDRARELFDKAKALLAIRRNQLVAGGALLLLILIPVLVLALRKPKPADEPTTASTSAPIPPSVSASKEPELEELPTPASASGSVAKGSTGAPKKGSGSTSGKNEKGFGKLKSLFK